MIGKSKQCKLAQPSAQPSARDCRPTEHRGNRHTYHNSYMCEFKQDDTNRISNGRVCAMTGVCVRMCAYVCRDGQRKLAANEAMSGKTWISSPCSSSHALVAGGLGLNSLCFFAVDLGSAFAAQTIKKATGSFQP